MELENRVASGRCVPATFGRACRYDHQEGRSRTRRRLSRQLDLRTTERQRQEVEDLEDYAVVSPRRCRAQAPSSSAASSASLSGISWRMRSKLFMPSRRAAIGEPFGT